MTPAILSRRLSGYDQPALDAAVEELFRALPAAGRIGPGKTVLLKPNLLAKHAPDKGVTTHPNVVRAVARAVKRRGAARVVLADSPGGVYNPALMQSLYKVSGMAAVCEEEGLELYTACRWGSRPVPEGAVAGEFTLLEPVLEADVIIDLPKLKTHVMTGCTAAVKNLFGCVPGLQKTEWHMRFPDKERFGEMLVDLLLTVKPDFAVLDGITAMEGDGPGGGVPRFAGLLLAGEDLPAMDLACCHVMGLDPMRVPYLAAAHRRGLCPAAFDPAWVEGEALERVPDWQLPSSYTGGGTGSTDFAERVPALLRPLAKKAEGWIAPHPVIAQAKCIGCGKCAEICPQHTIAVGRTARIRAAGCIRCFCCHEVCPVKAIDVKQLRLLKL